MDESANWAEELLTLGKIDKVFDVDTSPTVTVQESAFPTTDCTFSEEVIENPLTPFGSINRTYWTVPNGIFSFSQSSVSFSDGPLLSGTVDAGPTRCFRISSSVIGS
jgi:hypothetical protein